MSDLSQSNLNSLEMTARTAAAYLDACDGGAKYIRLDPDYYKACGKLLMTLFSAVDAAHAFPNLAEESAAARDVIKSIEIGRHLEISRLAYYPELAIIMNRASV
ncbi:MAG: hypothetical protein U0989_02885 [Azonexus sp.]|nr:hypothetical protein [Azonexus sp.]